MYLKKFRKCICPYHEDLRQPKKKHLARIKAHLRNDRTQFSGPAGGGGAALLFGHEQLFGFTLRHKIPKSTSFDHKLYGLVFCSFARDRTASVGPTPTSPFSFLLRLPKEARSQRRSETYRPKKSLKLEAKKKTEASSHRRRMESDRRLGELKVLQGVPQLVVARISQIELRRRSKCD